MWPLLCAWLPGLFPCRGASPRRTFLPDLVFMGRSSGCWGTRGPSGCCGAEAGHGRQSRCLLRLRPFFSLSGCPRAKKSGIRIAQSKEDKEDQEPIRYACEAGRGGRAAGGSSRDGGGSHRRPDLDPHPEHPCRRLNTPSKQWVLWPGTVHPSDTLSIGTPDPLP